VIILDERMTTVTAERALIAGGVRRDERKNLRGQARRDGDTGTMAGRGGKALTPERPRHKERLP
jgi:hypothetical protein